MQLSSHNRIDEVATDATSALSLSSRGPSAAMRTHLPHGVADYFWAEARDRRALESELLELFRSWGYADVIPPMFEYAGTYHARAGSELESETYRFLDRDGSTLALRADMTIPVARLVATRLHDWPMPQRFCYAGSVFRYTEPQAGVQREFAQTGVEIIGSGSPRADAEILALAARSLHKAGVNEFKLVIGQMGFFDALLEELSLSPQLAQSLQLAIDRNSHADLVQFIRAAALRPAQRRAVELLPQLNGPDVAHVLEQADCACLNSAMSAAVNNLRAVCAHLDAYGEADHLYADLTEIHNLGYYTGITFEALTPELGFPVASGGRYDHLVGTFGVDQAAVGVAFSNERLLLARRRSSDSNYAARPVAPTVIISPGDDTASMTIIDVWRSLGLSVAVDVDSRSPESLFELARKIGAPYCAHWTGDSLSLTFAGEPDAAPRSVSVENAAEMAAELLHVHPNR